MNYHTLCKMVKIISTFLFPLFFFSIYEKKKRYLRRYHNKHFYREQNKVFSPIAKNLSQRNTHTISVYRILQAGKPKWHLAGPYTNKRSGSGPPLPNRKEDQNPSQVITK